MDPQFEELAKYIADDVEKRFSTRFDDAEKRLESIIAKQLGEAEKRLDEVNVKRLGDAEKRLSDGAKMNMEELRTTVKVVAEGYGTTLDRIEQQIIELNGKVDTKLGDHDKVLNDHGARITALERRRRLKADR